jgi:hypothetical protein
MATNREARKRIERDEKARLRSELLEARRQYERAKFAVKAHRTAVVLERREQTKALREDLARIRGGYRGITRELLLALAARREAYRSWWREVLAEKQRRKDELAYLRELVAARKRMGPKEIASAVSLRLRQSEVDRHDIKLAAAEKRADLSQRVKSSKSAVRRASVDKKLASRVRRPVLRSTSTERRAEFRDAVLANLPEELQSWYLDHARLFVARPDESPDAVAERVVEAYEAEPESVERHASERADARVVELLREAGLYG